jgi:uncharacterized membrane protein
MMYSSHRTIGILLLALLFLVGGLGHFVKTGTYLRIMPPYIPWPKMLIYLSGVCEVLGGLGLLYEPTRSWAAWGLIVLLVAVFPANVYMAQIGYGAPQWVLWARLPLQIPLIWWTWLYTH